MQRALLTAATLLATCLPAAAPSVPCAPLCQCRADHFSCDSVPFHRFPPTGAGVRHVAVSGAALGTLEQAALDGRALRTLVLVASRLHHIEPDALASMVTSLASLDLGHNEFTELPLGALHELKALNWLNLQNNYIGEVLAGAEWGGLADSLSSLSLSNNHLVALEAGALTPLRRLAQLDLEGNRLHAVAGGALPASLALLRLSDNLLPALPCAALAALPRLRHLHLRNNPLRPAVERACRVDGTRVDSLDLGQNELDDLFALDVHRPQLKRLILDLNDFTAIPPFALEGGRLERLSMSHNRLSRVTDATLHALRRDLERLELDHNELTSLSIGAREMTRLRYLSLAYNRLEELEHLPPRLLSLALAGNHLSRFPAGLRYLAPATLLHLDLGYNRISALSERAFGPWAASLDTLGLKGNRIAELAADAFPEGLPLRELALGFNELDHVEATAFSNLTRLQVLELSGALGGGAPPPAPPALVWLSLDNSAVYCVTARHLADFSSLEYLNLDFNEITEFPSDADLASSVDYKMRELRLAYNYIDRVNGHFLQNMVELQSLDLSYNRVRTIDEGEFTSLPNLVYLSIAGNLVERVGRAAFRDLTRLTALDLRDNRLVQFSTRYFENVSNADGELAINISRNLVEELVAGDAPLHVHSLDLSYNRLASVPTAFFARLARLCRLSLANNRLAVLDGASFGALPNLLVLDLNDNVLSSMRRRAFAEMPALCILDLSRNKLSQLASEQFHGTRDLRHLRLASNELRALPRDCFQGTLLEHLDLANNRLTVYPSSSLAQVGFTLRRLDLARNRLEYLDAAMFSSTSFLRELGLASNALTALADNTFAPLARLRALDLSGNTLKANFKELFHALPRLRRLALADAGLRAVPPLPLPALDELELAGNSIASYREPDVRRLQALRRLDLARNRLSSLHPAMWAALPRLTDLDVSANPIVRIERTSFEGLGRLLRLRLERLRRLDAIEPRAFLPLRVLRSLSLDSPLGGGASLADVAASARSLEALTVTVRVDTLDTQLLGLAAPRLRSLEVRGAVLRRVSARAFSSLGRQRALTLRVRGTGVTTLPAGLARPLARVPLLALDFSDNRLTSFSPAALYPNVTDWNHHGTKLLPGGLALRGNELSCGCAVSWVGAWLRRWAAEVGGWSAGARGVVREARCGEGSGTVLVSLRADAASCRASALSSRAPLPPAPPFLWLVLLYSLS